MTLQPSGYKSPQATCSFLCLLLHNMLLPAARLELLSSLLEDFWPVTGKPNGRFSTNHQLIFKEPNSDVLHVCKKPKLLNQAN